MLEGVRSWAVAPTRAGRGGLGCRETAQRWGRVPKEPSSRGAGFLGLTLLSFTPHRPQILAALVTCRSHFFGPATKFECGSFQPFYAANIILLPSVYQGVSEGGHRSPAPTWQHRPAPNQLSKSRSPRSREHISEANTFWGFSASRQELFPGRTGQFRAEIKA